jgi:hypothetical protein
MAPQNERLSCVIPPKITLESRGLASNHEQHSGQSNGDIVVRSTEEVGGEDQAAPTELDEQTSQNEGRERARGPSPENQVDVDDLPDNMAKTDITS